MVLSNRGDEDGFDLTGIITGELFSLKFDYVLILEWLPDEDEKTGLALYEWLSLKLPNGKVEYVSCGSLKTLEERLVEARQGVRTKGIPIVHIETHGGSLVDGEMPDGFIRHGRDRVQEVLSWQRMVDILRPLNIATEFNLLVVGAACHGEGLLLGVEGGKPMPFVAAVGYTSTISTLSLKHSLRELYRSLLFDRAELGVAVDAANREHHFEDDAVLRLTPIMVLLAESFIQGIATSVTTFQSSNAARRWNPGMRSKLVSSLERLWSLMWMFDEMTGNAARFSIDSDRLVEQALLYAGVDDSRRG